jgi:hypothetical protein
MIQPVTGQHSARQKQPDKFSKYNADSFTINLLEGWQDKTVYTLAGPVVDNIQHNVVITAGQNVPFTSVREFAEWQIASAEQELKGCRLLKKGNTTLANGTSAHEAIFVWYPVEGLKVYQEQIFVLSEGTAYTLTATFTKKSRKTLGPQVERMMLSFEPLKPKPKNQGSLK